MLGSLCASFPKRAVVDALIDVKRLSKTELERLVDEFKTSAAPYASARSHRAKAERKGDGSPAARIKRVITKEAGTHRGPKHGRTTGGVGKEYERTAAASLWLAGRLVEGGAGGRPRRGGSQRCYDCFPAIEQACVALTTEASILSQPACCLGSIIATLRAGWPTCIGDRAPHVSPYRDCRIILARGGRPNSLGKSETLVLGTRSEAKQPSDRGCIGVPRRVRAVEGRYPPRLGVMNPRGVGYPLWPGSRCSSS